MRCFLRKWQQWQSLGNEHPGGTVKGSQGVYSRETAAREQSCYKYPSNAMWGGDCAYSAQIGRLTPTPGIHRVKDWMFWKRKLSKHELTCNPANDGLRFLVFHKHWSFGRVIPKVISHTETYTYVYMYTYTCTDRCVCVCRQVCVYRQVGVCVQTGVCTDRCVCTKWRHKTISNLSCFYNISKITIIFHAYNWILKCLHCI